MLIARISEKLKQDAKSVCSSIYRMNAPHAIGYVFNATRDRKEVSSGMFVTMSEIDGDRWTYYLDFKTDKFFKIGE